MENVGVAVLDTAKSSEPSNLTDDMVSNLHVPDINRIILAELRKIKANMSPSKAHEIVMKTLDDRITAIENNAHHPMTIAAAVPMMW